MSAKTIRRTSKPSVWRRALTALGLAKRDVPYDAASVADKGRKGWATANAGPNLVGKYAARIRARSRDMARNDPHCARAIDVIAGNIVGTGIQVSVRKPKKDEDPSGYAEAVALEALFHSWCESAACDAEGVHTYAALESIAARGLVDSGEVFARFRVDMSVRPIPLTLELLEADLLDEQRNDRLAGGGLIVQGVEFDARGRRVAYWFFLEHPGEGHPYAVGGRPASVRVPADEVLHLFVALRPRQVRGVPFLAPALAIKADLDTYERHELARKQTEAAVVAMVVPGDDVPFETDDNDEGLIPAAVNDDGDAVEDLQPRMILRLRNGKDVRFNSPQISANYDTYKRAMLQSVAVSVGLSYEWLSGDLSQANYSSLRGGLIEFWRKNAALQYNDFIPKFTARVFRRFAETAFLSGLVSKPYFDADFIAPAPKSVDPARESLGDVIDVRAGFAPWDEKVQARGGNPETVKAKAAALQSELGMLSLILDIDPSRVDFRGAMRNDRRGGSPSAVPPAIDGSADAESDP